MPAKNENVLLVEGAEDREVIYQLCNHHKIDNTSLFSVEPKEGYERLRDDLAVRSKVPGIKTLGAVIDADTDVEQRWQSVRVALAKSGYTGLPEFPGESGTIIPASEHLPRLGLWLMPDNRLSGMLEDFLQRLVQEKDSLLPRAQAAVETLPEAERRFQPVHHSKAIIHTWLAWQVIPGTPLGLAVKRRYLDGDHELAQRFVRWLRELFSQPDG